MAGVKVWRQTFEVKKGPLFIFLLATKTSREIGKGHYPVSLGTGSGVIYVGAENTLRHYDTTTKKSKLLYRANP